MVSNQFLPLVLLWALKSDHSIPTATSCYNQLTGEKGLCSVHKFCLEDQEAIGSCMEGSANGVCCKTNKFQTETPVFSMKTNISTQNELERFISRDHDERIPVPVCELHDMRKPVQQAEDHNERKSVGTHVTHDLRSPVSFQQSHDLRWPVLEEDSHDQRNTGIGLLADTSSVSASPTTPVALLVDANESLQFYEADVMELFSQTIEKNDEILVGRSGENMMNDLTQVCGRAGRNMMARLVGGHRSHYLRWPWMISLRVLKEKGYRHRCGAALLNHFWAITAAHCVQSLRSKDVRLRVGDYNLHKNDEPHPYEELEVFIIITHPNFQPQTYENDLALLRFYQPVKFQDNIAPVCLPKALDDVAGRTGVVTGWGKLSERGKSPGVLHEVHMPILTNAECEKLYAETGTPETISDVFLCAGHPDGGLDTCRGDSGGPLVVENEHSQWSLVGIVSWGRICAAPKQPGVYTRITKFLDFIHDFIIY